MPSHTIRMVLRFMKRLFDRKLFVGSACLVLLIVFNAGINYRNIQQLDDDARWVAHTHQVHDALNELLVTLRDAQTGQRGYILTNDREFLQPYTEAIATHDDRLERIRVLTEDNSTQQNRIPRLRELIAAEYELLADANSLMEQADQPAAQKIIQSGADKRLMDNIRALVREMKDNENRLLQEREDARRRTYSIAVATGFITNFLALAAIATAVWLFRRTLKMSRRAAAVDGQRDFLHATVSSLGDGVIVTDTLGNVTLLNRVAEELTGWRQADAVGMPMDQIFRIVNTQTRKPVENPALRALAENRVILLAEGTMLISNDGTEWPVDDSAAPIRDGNGDVTGAVLVFREIKARIEIEKEKADADRRREELLAVVRDSEVKFRSVVEGLAEGVFVIDAGTQCFVEANNTILKTLGYTHSELLALRPFDIFAGETPEAYAGYLRVMSEKLIRDGRYEVGRRSFLRKDGTELTVEIRATFVPNDGAGLHAFIVRDLTHQIAYEDQLFEYQISLEEANTKLKALAVTDGLTGAKNRAAFNTKLSEEFDRANRHNYSLSVILMDVDHFKMFNDTFGHPAGDDVLKSVVEVLDKTARVTDFVARYGGEEFAVIMPDTDYAGAMVLAERCRRAISGANWEKRSITVSIGVATLTPTTSTPSVLVQEADEALYRSKKAGRNRVNHGSGSITEMATART